MRSTLLEIYDRLYRAYGPQHWWPARTRTEIVVSAILTQNTAWTNVERAMENLRAVDALTWAALRDLDESALAELVRPSGTYRVKARRIKSFVEILWRDHDGSLDNFLKGPIDEARGRLLAVRGIGPETADAILLYAGGHAVFVVDAYTQRILRRHGLLSSGADYATTQGLFHTYLDRNEQVFNEYHALLVAVGKRHCRARAECSGCPLEPLPHDETR